MITGNKAQEISSGAFSLEADEFIFSGEFNLKEKLVSIGSACAF